MESREDSQPSPDSTIILGMDDLQRRWQIRGVDVNESSDSVEKHLIFQLVSPRVTREVLNDLY